MSKTSVIIEGAVKNKGHWHDKGYWASVDTDGGNVTVAFTHVLRVPKLDVRVRIHGNQGRFWVFAEKWEYLAPPKGKTDGTFPVKSDSEIEDAVVRRIRSLNEFTVDDFHTLEILHLIKKNKRDKRVLGSVLRKFKTKDWIKEIRQVHSRRKECHHRPIVLWTRTVHFDKIMEIAEQND